MAKQYKNRLTTLLLLLSTAAASAAYAGTVSIADAYWGGTPGKYGSGQVASAATGADVIGASVFDIQGMDVTLTGNILTVKINTNYSNKSGPVSGTVYGDLLISTTGWHPYTAAGCGAAQFYACDTFANTGTNWNYAVDTSSGGLYAVARGNIITTDQAFGQSSTTTYRTGQATLINGGTFAGAASFDDSHAGVGGYLVYTVMFRVWVRWRPWRCTGTRSAATTRCRVKSLCQSPPPVCLWRLACCVCWVFAGACV